MCNRILFNIHELCIHTGLALVSMCLSLIQENVARYASYSAKEEEEDTLLDLIIPCRRIPNYFEKVQHVKDFPDGGLKNDRNDFEGQFTDDAEITIPGTLQNHVKDSKYTDWTDGDMSRGQIQDKDSMEYIANGDDQVDLSDGEDTDETTSEEDSEEEDHETDDSEEAESSSEDS